MATIRPETRTGGYIFSVVNPLDTVVQLGLHMSPVIKDKWNITFYYADSSVHSTSQKLISYEIPYAKKWTRIALKVLSNKITIFLNCIETETFTVKREPIELVFDTASTFYLAQAGPIIKGHFEVSTFMWICLSFFLIIFVEHAIISVEQNLVNKFVYYVTNKVLWWWTSISSLNNFLTSIVRDTIRKILICNQSRTVLRWFIIYESMKVKYGSS